MDDLIIYVVSGGTGRTGAQILNACLAQFPQQATDVRLATCIHTSEAAVAVAQRCAGTNAVICHSLVNPLVRRALVDSAQAVGVPCVDFLGPTLAILGDRFGVSPAGKAGLLYELHKDQFDRMDAVDFTMAHDDGQRLHDLDQAEVVLVGISRVSKSVTCFYLACRGIRAANVPLIGDLPPPDELLAIDASKVFGLTMNAAHLASIRQTRLDRIAANHDVPGYASIRDLTHQIRQAERLFAAQAWTTLDVSYKATEEVAAEILHILHHRASPAS